MSGQVDDPEIDARRAARTEKVREHLSVAERLTLRAKNRRETITIGDGDDAVAIEIRVPLACEVREIEEMQRRVVHTGVEMQRLIQQMTDLGINRDVPDRDTRRAKITAELEGLRAQADTDLRRHLELVADIIVDESVTAEYLGAGEMGIGDVGLITQEILNVVRDRAADARSFRNERARKGSVPAVRETGQTPP